MARLVIDMPVELHRVMKSEAALRGTTIRDFVLSTVHAEISKSHKPSKSSKHSCPLCDMYDGKTVQKAPRKLVEAPLTPYNNRHYIFEDELPYPLKNI